MGRGRDGGLTELGHKEGLHQAGGYGVWGPMAMGSSVDKQIMKVSRFYG